MATKLGGADGRVAEDHGEHEAKRDGVHRGVVQRAGRAEAAGKSRERAGAEPDVAAEQADADEAGEAVLAGGVAGDVEDEQPDGEGEQSCREDHQAGRLGEGRGQRTGEDDASDRDKSRRRRRTRGQEARQLQPFAGDRQHQEGEPEGHCGVQCAGADPHQIARQPARSANRQHHGK